MERLAKGIWKIRYGEPECITPQSQRIFSAKLEGMEKIPVSRNMHFKEQDIEFHVTNRGVNIEIPMSPAEDIFGFGLQLLCVNAAGRRRYLKVNSDPPVDTGESHAPVPFFISSEGYGIYVDTYRYTSFLMGTSMRKGESAHMSAENENHEEFSESALYSLKKSKEVRDIIIDVPTSKGIDIYIFEGNVKEVVQRYNMFSGGGCLPPLWGLGAWYRSYGGSDQETILKQAEELRAEHIPVDVLGLEPGWHSHSYSCTYKWSSMFKDPDQMVKELQSKDYKVNLWEHLFVYPKAPFYEELMPYSGNYEVWNGLVPDLGTKEARTILEDYHYNNFVKKGIMGFKLDECDNSDYNPSNWSFPDAAVFPSGFDGEQMHTAVGNLYQQLIFRIFRKANKRTLSQVRSAGALSAPLPFVLYSDLYKHSDFIRGNVTAGFSGLLWCPEVRNCVNQHDLLRRIQTTVFSAQTLINSWRIPSPPWKQTDINKNLKGERMPEADCITDEVRSLLKTRMSLIPYLYSAFVRYYYEGIPPIRSLVLDYPEDETVKTIDDQYMFGDSMMVCPLTWEDGNKREIYFPEGVWYNYFKKEKIQGAQWREVNADYNEIPVYVCEGAIIPTAHPVECITNDTVFQIDVLVFGEGQSAFKLYQDDFYSFDYEKDQKEILIQRLQNQELILPDDTAKYTFKEVKYIN